MRAGKPAAWMAMVALVTGVAMAGSMHTEERSVGVAKASQERHPQLDGTAGKSSLESGPPVPAGPSRGGRAVIPGALLVKIRSPLRILSRPGGGHQMGVLPATSMYFSTPITAWIIERGIEGAWGRVVIPYSGNARRTGWIRLAGLRRLSTPYTVRVNLTKHSLTLLNTGRVVDRMPVAVGRPTSPTPSGRYFVTDRVATPPNGPYGPLAFGLSGIQPNLPAGWGGGVQLAIHGTNNHATIGQSVTSGCVRVSDEALLRLSRVLRIGTPVIIVP